MFGIIGFVFGLMFGTSKFALHNLVRAAAIGLVGYLVYELISGYTRGKAGLPAPAVPDELPTATPADHSPLTGSSKQGRPVYVADGTGGGRTARVGRGVVRR
jgi:hypothetical protein